MASELPDPLTPATSDLRDFPYLPLDVVRLRDSDMAAVEDPEAFRAAVMLWCASWHQVPAASLPDDNLSLCRLAGYGRDAKMWRRARSAGALRGWIPCSDGRLYHPVVAEKANSALAAKQAQRDKTEAARAARAARRQGVTPPPASSPSSSVTDSVTLTATESVAASVTDSVTERQQTLSHDPSEGKGREGKGIEEEDSVKRASSIRTHARTPHEGALRAGPMPTLVDPPSRWFALADKTEIDNEGVERPVVGGWYLDEVARMFCEAARINGATRPVDWLPLTTWLRDGLDPHEQIIPIVRKVAARSGYTPPRFLSYFDQAVREGKAA